MNKLLKRATVVAAALAIATAPLPGMGSIGHWLGDTNAYAGGNGNNGNHGNSGGNGNGGGNGNSNAGGSNSAASDTHGNSADHRNIASLAGSGNAAHASVQGLLHASPNSQVGKVKAYADVEFKAIQLQTAVKTDASAIAAAQDAFGKAYPDFVGLTGDALAAALATPEGVAALASPEGVALTKAEGQLATDTAALTNTTTKAGDALALVTRNPGPAVQSYIDGLLTKYFAYLTSQLPPAPPPVI